MRRLSLLLVTLLASSVSIPLTASAQSYTYPPPARVDAYVASSVTNTVTVIDTVTTTVRGTVAVAAGPSQLAIQPDGSKVFVSHPALGRVTVIDSTTLTVTGTIPTSAGPGALAVTPDGQHLYVATPGAVQVVDLATSATVRTITTAGTATQIAFRGDGTRAYLATGLLSVIDTATGVATATAIPATSVALAPSGATVYTSAADAVRAVDGASLSVSASIGLGGTTGPLALTPDGSRLYSGVQGFSLVSSSYGTFNVAFRHVAVIETSSNTRVATITVPAPVTRLAVTPNRSDLYMLIPNTSVPVASINTNAIRRTLVAGSVVTDLAITPNPHSTITPYLIDAVNDTATAAVVNDIGGTPVSNVLVNDRFAGLPATLGRVSLVQVSSTDPGLRLNELTGAVTVQPGTPPGAQSLVYRICERANPTNCDQATVAITVRAPYVIDAVNDNASTYRAASALNVLTNDLFNGRAATTATVRVTQLSSSHAGVAVAATGVVTVSATTPFGPQSLTYRICEAASPLNCDSATVTLNVIPFVIDAVNDLSTIAALSNVVSQPIANVLANDTLAGTTATLARVSLAQVSASDPRISLNVATGAVRVDAGAAPGTQTVEYRICELANPTNCDQATATVSVRAPNLIDAVDDAASLYPGTVALNVLGNDRLNLATATTAVVTVTQVSTSHPGVALAATGVVNVASTTPIGAQTLTYRICEITNPTNCDSAVVRLTVNPFHIDARDDLGTVTRGGGYALASVLTNDLFKTGPATTSNVRISLVWADPGLTLLTGNGAIYVSSDMSIGDHSLVYRICEIANPTNCDEATATVAVTHLRIHAVNDYVKASSNSASTPLASVLANDTLNGAPATLANVTLSFVSMTPASPLIRFNLSDGSVDVLGKIESGTYAITYRICEIEYPDNCDVGVATIDLSGSSGGADNPPDEPDEPDEPDTP